MEPMKTLFLLSIFILVATQTTHGIKCHICDGTTEKSCANAPVEECTPQLADATKTYLDKHYLIWDGEENASSKKYNCITNYLHTLWVESYYQGCVYNTMHACSYPGRVLFNKINKCNLCNTDGCTNNVDGIVENVSNCQRATNLLIASVVVILVKFLN